MSQHVIGGSSVLAHDRRHEKFKKDQETWERPTNGRLLSPMPKAPAVRPRKKKAAPKQVQVNHRWSYVVLWYEEIRRHTPAGFAIGPIEFTAIAAYRDLFQIDMEPFEVELLMKLDLLWRDCLPKEKPRPEK